MHYSGILLFLAVILVFCPTVHCHKKNQAHFNPKTTLQYINYQFPQSNNNCLNSSVVELPTLDWEVVGSIPGWGKSFNLLITSIFVEDSIGQSIWSNLQVLFPSAQKPFPHSCEENGAVEKMFILQYKKQCWKWILVWPNLPLLLNNIR